MKTNMGMMAMCVALLAGCTIPVTGTGASGGSSGGAGSNGGGSSSANGVTCSAIVDCAGKCASGDDACVNACIANGTPAAQTQATALKKCIDTNACADATCLQAKCSSEVAACEQSSASPSGGSTPPASGSVPSDLVGEWQDSTELLAFYANGQMHRQTNVTTGSCNTFGAEDGTASVSGDSLTFSLTSGNILVCGQQNGAYQPSTEEYTYSIETRDGVAGQYQALVLTKKNCTDAYCEKSYDRTM